MIKKQNATIYDVANKVGVSLATVSRVVNGNTNVRASTKEKVLAAIDELGYQPNAVARGLASKKTTTIGVVMPDVTNLYYSELTRGIDDVANMYHYDVLVTNTDDDPVREVMAINNLATKQVDGIIFMGNELDQRVLKAIESVGVPVVLAGSVDPAGQLPSVNIDYVAAMHQITSQLLDNGHEHVAVVLGDFEHAINQEYRFAGYKRALEEHGHEVNRDYLFTKAHNYQTALDVAPDVMKSGATGIVVYDDEVAIGILNYLQDHGAKIPADFEIVTSNDTNYSIVSRPQLSSIGQPKYDIGAVAMRMLTKLMDNIALTELAVTLPHTFIERQTTRKRQD
ncbi:substrate-binding domain-containing protein [Eupransor demetentiae]|uniref:LacI/PurR family (PurR) n=1 Tax=Eupransor demetentiae TaxID=3109584 RepID=A0ABM9N351_9LACO|nr:DNA-binding transcriptional regulator [Lactobacillaceae bacterium LMG 33000]